MSTVEELIGNLLLRHNCVIVPSFGGFVAKQTSATIDYKSGVMLPPRKSILFNRQLINNDGLLISEFAASNQVYYSSAEASVKYSVADWNDKLRNGERVTLDRVGHLFYDQEKNICFEQDRFFNLLLESYGLGKVHFVSEEDLKVVQHISERSPIHSEEVEESPFRLVALPIIDTVDVCSKEEDTVLHPAVKEKSRVWKYIAAAVLLPVGFYSFWIPMKTNVLESGLLSFRDFNTSYRSEEGLYEKVEFKNLKTEKFKVTSLESAIQNLPANVFVYNYSFSRDLFIPVQLKEDNIVSAEQEPNVSPIETTVLDEVKQVKAKPLASNTGSFDYIVNCFSSEENATAFVSLLKEKGLNAYIISDKVGLFRVSAGNARSSDEMSLIAEKSKSSGFTGWILKK
jgi:hypothetical protein